MINVKLVGREVYDLLDALNLAMDDYMIRGKEADTDNDIQLFEAKAQRAAALHHKLTTAQLRAG